MFCDRSMQMTIQNRFLKFPFRSFCSSLFGQSWWYTRPHSVRLSSHNPFYFFTPSWFARLVHFLPAALQWPNLHVLHFSRFFVSTRLGFSGRSHHFLKRFPFKTYRFTIFLFFSTCWFLFSGVSSSSLVTVGLTQKPLKLHRIIPRIFAYPNLTPCILLVSF